MVDNDWRLSVASKSLGNRANMADFCEMVAARSLRSQCMLEQGCGARDSIRNEKLFYE